AEDASRNSRSDIWKSDAQSGWIDDISSRTWWGPGWNGRSVLCLDHWSAEQHQRAVQRPSRLPDHGQGSGGVRHLLRAGEQYQLQRPAARIEHFLSQRAELLDRAAVQPDVLALAVE